MKIVNYEVRWGINHIGTSPIREQAVAAAKRYSAQYGKDMQVIAHLDNGQTRRITVKPDGSIIKDWQMNGQSPMIYGGGRHDG